VQVVKGEKVFLRGSEAHGPKRQGCFNSIRGVVLVLGWGGGGGGVGVTWKVGPSNFYTRKGPGHTCISGGI